LGLHNNRFLIVETGLLAVQSMKLVYCTASWSTARDAKKGDVLKQRSAPPPCAISTGLYCNDGDWLESCTALVEHPDGTLEILR